MFLYHVKMEKYIKYLLEGIDENIQQIEDWTTDVAHYRYHVKEKVTAQSEMTRAADNQYVWTHYAVKIGGSADSTAEINDALNPPEEH
jgi:hypothetical protein